MNTLVLAQILGIVFVVLGLSMFFQKKNTVLAMEELFHSRSLMWIGGTVALMIGVTVVVLNNDSTYGLSLLVAIIGWLAIIKGLFILLFPSKAAPFYRKFNTEGVFVLVGVVVFILGLALIY